MSIKLNLSKKEKTVRKTIAFKESQSDLLDEYIKYIDSLGYEADINQIVSQVVERFLASEKEFKSWLKKKERSMEPVGNLESHSNPSSSHQF